MISKIHLKNFQGYSEFKLELSPTVTTIVGDSDRGKSAVLRALRWVAMNKPTGTSFIKHGEKQCTATARIDDIDIRRLRSKAENLYQMRQKSKVQKFASFKNDVPGPIADLINIGPINFQGQHDAPFMFSLTAGETSKALNQIVDLSIIDRSLSFLASNLTSAKQEQTTLSKLWEEAVAEVNKLAYVNRLDADYSKIEKLDKSINHQSNEIEDLHDDIEYLVHMHKESSQNANCIEAGTVIIKRAEAVHAQAKIIARLTALITDVEQCEKSIGIEIPDITALDKHFAAAALCRETYRRAGGVYHSARDQFLGVTELVAELESMQEQLTDAMGDTCPLCGQPTDIYGEI